MGKPQAHVDQELLQRYVMSTLLAIDLPAEEELSAETKRYVEQHLRGCKECRERVERFRSSVSAGDDVLAQVLSSHLGEAQPSLAEILDKPKVRPIFISTMLAVILVILAALFSRYSNPDYAHQASIHNEPIESIRGIRGGDFFVTSFFNAMTHLAMAENDSAIIDFRSAIKSTNEPSRLAMAHLYIGLANLKKAERRTLWLFYDFKQQYVDSAMIHLTASVHHSEKFPDIRGPALFFVGKAHLMRSDPQAAIIALRACEEIGGEKAPDAHTLLEELSKRMAQTTRDSRCYKTDDKAG
jgi:hypothetical protein